MSFALLFLSAFFFSERVMVVVVMVRELGMRFDWVRGADDRTGRLDYPPRRDLSPVYDG